MESPSPEESRLPPSECVHGSGRSESGRRFMPSFLSAWAHNPRTVGAIAPSSKKLSETIASFVERSDRWVVELGAGTGPVTSALLRHGVEPSRLLVVERSPRLADILKKRFPNAQVVEGDAADLGGLLGERDIGRVGTVVSSLPLRSLPKTVGRRIVKEIDRVLADDGKVIQFTYDPRRGDFYSEHFQRTDHRWVLSNLPPARVDVFQRPKRV